MIDRNNFVSFHYISIIELRTNEIMNFFLKDINNVLHVYFTYLIASRQSFKERFKILKKQIKTLHNSLCRSNFKQQP